ncbi:Hypothetical predicted protein, partial [Paramuricea clavata]
MWAVPLPPPALMALSRGIHGGGSYGINWYTFYRRPRGNVKKYLGESYYLP